MMNPKQFPFGSVKGFPEHFDPSFLKDHDLMIPDHLHHVHEQSRKSRLSTVLTKRGSLISGNAPVQEFSFEFKEPKFGEFNLAKRKINYQDVDGQCNERIYSPIKCGICTD